MRPDHQQGVMPWETLSISTPSSWLLEAAELVHGLVNHTLWNHGRGAARYKTGSAPSGIGLFSGSGGSQVRFYFEDVPWKGSATAAPAWVAPCFTAISAIEHSEPQAYAQTFPALGPTPSATAPVIDGIDEFTSGLSWGRSEEPVSG